MTNTCQGRWSDQHITANSKLSKEEKQSLVTGVGEWWMLYDDFTKCFTHLTICHPEPEPEQRQAKVYWKETSFEVPSQLAGLQQVLSPGKLGQAEWWIWCGRGRSDWLALQPTVPLQPHQGCHP